MRFLLFRLYGPLASWGDAAVGENRPSWGEPSKSAVLGIVGAALGLRREEAAALTRLHAGYHFACSTEAPGTVLLDYHTIQRAKEKHFKTKAARGRREELAIGRDELETIITRREYRCDGSWTACLWAAVEPAPWALDELAAALHQPKFTLYLGRKSCPPALPMAPNVVEAGHPLDALMAFGFPDAGWTPRAGRRTYRWEALEDQRAVGAVERRDDPRDRIRRSFAVRREFFAVDDTQGGERVSEPD